MHTILNLRGYTERENHSQAITNILLANREHLELLRLNFLERPGFLPPSLKYLRVRHCGNDDDEVLFELAAEQCPKLCGLEYYGLLTLRTINAILCFEKFVA